MPAPTLVLASASPARLGLLRAAGFAPVVQVSGVDEDAVRVDDPAGLVAELARRKAAAVAAAWADGPAVVVGCDSMLVVDGAVYGKPESAAQVRERWARMAGGTGTLLTGHCVVDTERGTTADDVAATIVRFGRPSAEELEAYIASREPFGVAGGFTLDGRSAPFVTGIEGDPGNVIGLSLPLLRDLLARLDRRITDLWA